MKHIYIIFLLILIIPSCTYNTEEELYGLACDTSNVRYSVEIKSILDAGCLACHAGNAAAGAGIKLDSYQEVKKYVELDALLESITRENNYMPKGAPRLSACKIEQIRNWINKGAPNN